MEGTEVPVKSGQLIISARQTGPGPGVYKLPPMVGYKNHDFTKDRRPAYTFGHRYPFLDKEMSPGPAYFVRSGITNHGKDGIPAYTARSKFGDQGIFRTPAPNAYNTDKCLPPGEKKAPKYTMRARTRYRQTDPNPAPNKYDAPRVMGPNTAYTKAEPAYTMRKNLTIGSFSEDLGKSPGPSMYDATSTNVYRDRQPIYSLRQLTKLPGDEMTKPGPAAHRREDVTVNMPRAPAFPMGVRHSEYETTMFVDLDPVYSCQK
ncbi:outer dense fiber protein 3-like [Gigantopelta aegis]|uniref:outer dense fiber protein 3-like n=1 Tax=Gigantopelta aegis TaxID=1735272 RepID=UPI001B888F37|nr:outer dense fiber protein 3-like [Gigantopelta aegis]